jgi:hypothetical protein
MAVKARVEGDVYPRVTQLETRRREAAEWIEEWIAAREIRRNARTADCLALTKPRWFEDLVHPPYGPGGTATGSS